MAKVIVEKIKNKYCLKSQSFSYICTTQTKQKWLKIGITHAISNLLKTCGKTEKLYTTSRFSFNNQK